MRIVKVNAETFICSSRRGNNGREEDYYYWSKPEPKYINPSFIFGISVEEDTVTFDYSIFSTEYYATYRVKRSDFDKFCDYIDLTEKENKND